MDIRDTTIGIPVADLAMSQLWYEAVFELDPPEDESVEGIVAYNVAGIWLQLSEEPESEHGGTVVRFGIADATAEHARLEQLGVDVSPLVQVDGSVAFFDVADPDGNLLSFYTVIS
jgi:predicted enzyme related to lactoylglutathione lyase